MKIKTILVYILLILMIILSFAIPKMITKIQDKKVLSDKYTTNKNIKTLNENAKSIELIETIYSKYNANKYDVHVSNVVQEAETVIIRQGDTNSTKIDININGKDDAINKVSDLIKWNIIDPKFYDQINSKFIMYKTWDYDNGNVKYSTVKILTGENLDDEIASLEIENETNKIISYTVKKEYSSTCQSTLIEYVKYLELDTMFNDWEYKDNELKSKAAGIKAVGNVDDSYIYIKMIPFEY